jgi:hypothetical protein
MIYDSFGLPVLPSSDQEGSLSGWAEFENPSSQPYTSWRSRAAAREHDTQMQSWTSASKWTPRKAEAVTALEEASSEVTEPVASAPTEATNRPAIPEPREEPCQVATRYVRTNAHTGYIPNIADNRGIHSPYGGRAIEVLIGRKRERYIVPSNLARQIPCLRPGCEFNGIVHLPNVNEDIGHTFMHFLYTGEYETAKSPSAPASATAPDDTTDPQTEYNRSVLAYQAAISCGSGLEGLAEHAKDRMYLLYDHIPIFDILSLGRRTLATIDDAWFSNYLTDRIIERFEEDEGIFVDKKFLEMFGQAVEFDKFLAQVMAKAYATKLDSIRDEAHSAIVEAQSREDVWRDWEELSAYENEDEDENDSTKDKKDEQDNNDQEAEHKPETEEQEPSEEAKLTLSSGAEMTSDENENDSWKPDPASYDPSDKIYPMHCPKWREHFSDESCHSCNTYLESVEVDPRW